jgi:hypothetical protein
MMVHDDQGMLVPHVLEQVCMKTTFQIFTKPITNQGGRLSGSSLKIKKCMVSSRVWMRYPSG